MAAASLKDQANGTTTRLSRLLVDKGTEALRQTFDDFHPPATLQKSLNTNSHLLQALRYTVINDYQWKLLYPTSGNPDSKNFDITLLSVLLRNICVLTPPVRGWNTLPLDTDRSLEANLVRVKVYRNEIFAHVTSTGVSDSEFYYLWPKISQTLNELGISTIETGKLITCPLSPIEEKYLKILINWKLQDDKLDVTLKEIKVSAAKILKTSGEIKGSIPEITQELQQTMANESRGIKESITLHTNEIKEAIVKNQSESSGQSAADQNLLQQLCKFNFSGDVGKSVGSFHPGTREWLFKNIEIWFSEKKSNVFLLTAGPGVGKTVLAAKIISVYQYEKQCLAACHFCKFNNSNYRDPLKMIQSLACQLCDSVEGFKQKLLEQLKRPNKVENLHDAFQVHLKEPLSQLPERKPMLVVIDALDECQNDERTELLDVLEIEFATLPSWLKVLVTSRPGINVRKKLKSFQYTEIQSNDKDNNKDIKRYLEDHLSTQSKRKGIISFLVKECQGSFLYAFYLQKHLQNCKAKITKNEIASRLPQGINSIYHDYFTRLSRDLQATSEHYNIFNLLNIIAVAHGAIPLTFITEVGLDRGTMKDIIGKVNESVSTLLFVNNDLVTVFHKSVVDWLKLAGDKEHKYTANCDKGNELLWNMSKRRFEEIKENRIQNEYRTSFSPQTRRAVNYALENGFNHLPLPSAQSSWAKMEDYEWLVDVYIFSLIWQSGRSSMSELWKYFRHPMSNDDPLAAIGLKASYYDIECVNTCQTMQNIRNSDLFSDEEKDYAKNFLIRSNYDWFDKLHPLHLHSDNIQVTACAFSPDGSYLVSCAADGRIHIWNVESSEVVQKVADDCKQVICCFWCDYILIFRHVGNDVMLSKYRVNQDSNVHVEAELIKLATENAIPLACSLKAFIYRCTNDSTVKVHYFTDNNEISVPELNPMEKFAVTGDGSSILAADIDEFQIWTFSNGTLKNSHSGKWKEARFWSGVAYEDIQDIARCSISTCGNKKYGITFCRTKANHNVQCVYAVDIDQSVLVGLGHPPLETHGIAHAETVIEETILCLQSEKRLSLHYQLDDYSRDFNHNGYLDYYKGGSICRSVNNIIALPQESGGICLVKIHFTRSKKLASFWPKYLR